MPKHIQETQLTSVLQAVYPVGALYLTTVATNPATVFGFGTWVAYAEGRTLVGKAASGTFGTAGATVGAETHTLTNAEMPVHSLFFNIHGSENGTDIVSAGGTGATVAGSVIARYGNHPTFAGSSSIQNPSWSWGSNTAHNNIQPSIVTYIWQRSA